MHPYLICLSFLIVSSVLGTHDSDYIDGLCSTTPPDIRETFLKKCDEIIQPEDSLCTDFWNSFTNVVTGMSPRNITPSDYEPVFNTLPIKSNRSGTLFWAQNRPLDTPDEYDQFLRRTVQSIADFGAQFLSTSNQNSSLIVGNITGKGSNVSWCSNSSTDNFDFDNACPCSVSENFWVEVYSTVAEEATGMVFYLTNGEKPGGALRKDSFFYLHGLPSLSASQVTRVVVIDIHRDGVGESCLHSCGSLAALRRQVERKSIDYSCYEIYGNIRNETTNIELSMCLAKFMDAIQQDGADVTGRVLNCSQPLLSQFRAGSKIIQGSTLLELLLFTFFLYLL